MSPRRVVPTAPVKSTLPPVPAFSVSFSAFAAAVVASSLPLKVMSAPAALPLVVLTVTSPAAPPFSVTSVAKLTASPVVVIVRGAVIVTNPAPFCVTAPSEVMFPFKVSSPEFVNVTVPPVVVVIVLFAVIALVVSATPVAVSVFTAPVNSVVPLPALCTRLEAVSAAAVTAAALVIVIAPTRVPPPTAPVNTTLPVPAVSPSVSVPAPAPSSVPLKVMLPAPVFVPIATAFVSLTASEKTTLAFPVVTPAPSSMGLALPLFVTRTWPPV